MKMRAIYATFTLLALLPRTHGKQAAFVDLSASPTAPEPKGQAVAIRGGGVLYHGNAPRPLPGTPPVSLTLRRVISVRDGAAVKDIVEVIMTNVGKAPISIPVGTAPVSLLAANEKNRRFLDFSVRSGRNGRLLGSARSASSEGHPESTATLQPGDTAVFWIPAGIWRPDAATSENAEAQEATLSVLLHRKVLENGTDWIEAVGEPVYSQNSLPLPHAATPEVVR